MAAFDAERGDDQVDRFSDGNSAPAQMPVVRGCPDRELGIAERDDLEAPELPLDEPSLRLRPQTLQYFAQNEIAHQQWRHLDITVEALDRRRRDPVQVIDPDRAIDEDHRRNDPAGFRPSRLPNAPFRQGLESPSVPRS